MNVVEVYLSFLLSAQENGMLFKLLINTVCIVLSLSIITGNLSNEAKLIVILQCGENTSESNNGL